MNADETQVHATCVAIDGAGVLLRGVSGGGKSDLALRLIDGGAALVADDRVDLARHAAGLVATAPPILAGKLEVRGIGIVRLDAAPPTPVRLVVDLIEAAAVERLPDDAAVEILGVALARVELAAFESSTPVKVRLALDLALGNIMPGDGND